MTLGFSTYEVRDLGSVAGLFPAEAGIRGIYVLHFADGTAYVGQTVNIWNRFAAHRRTYRDLDHLAFARVPDEPGARSLDDLEIDEMRAQARIRELRNITHYLPSTTRPSRLDPVVSLDHQLSFQDGEHAEDIDGRVVTEEQREKGRKAFARFRSNPLSELAEYLAANYVHHTIPCPRATERRFWALSAAPSTNAGNRLFCFSINKPETFVLFDLGGGEVHGFVNVSRTALAEAYGSLDRFTALYDDWIDVEEDAGYEACGGDAVRLRIDDAQNLSRLFEDPENEEILHAARVMNLALMRKGPTFQAKGHNVPLADVVLDEILAGVDAPTDREPQEPVERPSNAGSMDRPLTPSTPYSAFEGRLPHLLTDDVIRSDALGALVDVVASEGPVVGTRIHHVVVRAAGSSRAGARWRHELNSLLSAAVRRGVLVQDAPLGERPIAERTYRLPDQPPVRIRTLGPREFVQIPPRELAAVLTEAARSTGSTDPEIVTRAAAAHYGISRLGSTVRRRLEAAMSLCEPGLLSGR